MYYNGKLHCSRSFYMVNVASEFNANQAWQVSLAACGQLVNGGHEVRV